MIEDLVKITALLADESRLKLLWLLLDSRAFTTTELAVAADISVQNASNHLKKLERAGLLVQIKQGRHSYFALRNPQVATIIESLPNLLPHQTFNVTIGNPHHGDYRKCRTCYDHLAGDLAVKITAALLSAKYFEGREENFIITAAGEDFFNNLGIDVAELKKQKRPLLKPCLDWTERRFHFAGSIGAAFCQKLLENNWLRRRKDSRACTVTATGRAEIYKLLGITV